MMDDDMSPNTRKKKQQQQQNKIQLVSRLACKWNS